jgi:hypothetical protein
MPEELMNLALMRPVSRVVNGPVPHGVHPYVAPFLIVYFPIPNLAVPETSLPSLLSNGRFPTARYVALPGGDPTSQREPGAQVR